MNLLVISQYYYPEQFRITDICETLAAQGNKVTVLCGVPNYPEGEIYPGYENGSKRHEVINNVEIIRCNNRPRHRGHINLALNYLSFVRKANKEVDQITGSYDAVFVYEISPITMAIPAIRYGKRNNVPVYLYCMDIWPECVRDIRQGHTMSKASPVFQIAKIISKRVYDSVDMIGIKCKPFQDYLVRECKVDADKTELLYEHAESIYLSVNEKPVDNGIYDFFFLGNIGHAQNCRVILDAVKRMDKSERILVHFVGDGSEKNDLVKYAEDNCLTDRVVFHDKCSLKETLSYYEIADCCLLTLSSLTESGVTLPGKLVGYMGAARPVIAAAVGATETIINESNCGICVKPEDVDGLSRAMQNAIEQKDKYIQFGKNGRQFFVEHFTIQMFTTNLLFQLNIAVKEHHESPVD